MTFRKPLTFLTGATALLLAGQVMAAQTSGDAAPAPASTSSNSAVLQTPQGQVTVRSVMPPAPADTTPPPFAQLAGSGKAITPQQAAAYPLLANDFDYADSNRDGRISAKEYARWAKQQ